MADTKDTKPAAEEKTAASIQRIPSRCVKKFFDPSGAMIEEGQSCEFVRTPDNFYPWRIMRPEDKTLEEALRKEYFDARAAIDKEAKERNAAALADVFARLAGAN